MIQRTRSIAVALVAAGLVLSSCAQQQTGFAVAAPGGPAAPAAPAVPGSTDPGAQDPGTSVTTPATTGPATTASSAEPSATGASATAVPAGDLDPAAFVAKMVAGMKDVTSVTGKLSTTGAAAEKATFVQTLHDGKLTAATIDMSIDAGGTDVALKMIIVDDKFYLGGDPSMLSSMGAGGTKKWVLVSADSSNKVVASMGKLLDGVLATAGLQAYSAMAKAVTSVTTVGPEAVGGTPATHYKVVIDVAKLASVLPDGPMGEAMAASGLKTIPADYWLDAQGRMLRVVQNVEVGGQKASTDFQVTNYNDPVTIKAPDPSTVATG